MVQQSTDNRTAKVYEPVYMIERVLTTRTPKVNKQFFVKWEGYGPEHNSWVNETDMFITNTENSDCTSN